MIAPLLDILVACILISLTLHCWRDRGVARLAGDFGWGYVLVGLVLLSLGRVLVVGEGIPQFDIVPFLGLERWRSIATTGLAAGGFALLAIGLTQCAVAFKRLSTETDGRLSAQERPTESNRRFEDIAGTAADWIWEFDEHGRIGYVSGRIKDVTGLEPDFINGKRWQEADWVDPKTDLWRSHFDALEARRPFRSFQFPYRRADGRTLTLSISGKPIFSPDGTYRGYRGTGTDVSAYSVTRQRLDRHEHQIERKRAFLKLIARLNGDLSAQQPDQINRALKQTVAELGRYTEADQCYVCVFARQHESYRCIAEWAREGGIHTPDEYQAVPTDWMPHWLSRMQAFQTYHLVSPEQVPNTDDGLKTLLRREGIETLIEIPLAPGGRLTGFLGLSSRLKDIDWTNDDIVLMEILANTVGDALGRLGLDRTIRENERQLSSLLINLPGGAYRLRRTGPADSMPTKLGFDYATPGFQGLMGFEPDTLEHMNTSQILTLVHPDDQRRVFVDDPANRCDQPYSRTFRIITAEGWERWVQDRGRLVFAEGETRCIEGLLSDITAIRKLEDENRKLEADLIQAQRMEAVGELAGGIAHDFNNLLGAIDGFARFVHEDTEPTSELNKYADRIMRGCSRAERLVAQLLSVSSSQAPREQTVRLADIAAETVELMQGAIPAQICLTLHNELPDATVQADPTQISQVLVNLCLNARNALSGSRGQIAITIAKPQSGKSDNGEELHRQIGRPQAGVDYVEIRVKDTGQGMPVSILNHIFEPRNAARERNAGHGFGLAMVERIVTRHGGVIAVRSDPGRGSTFSISLLVCGARRSDADSQNRGDGVRSVLMIEDDVAFGDLVSAGSERLGYEVAVCNEAGEALTTFGERPEAWDLVITDQTTPETRGLDIIRRIKAIRTDVPCLLCTGTANTPAPGEVVSAGADDHLTKPVAFDTLADRVATLLETA